MLCSYSKRPRRKNWVTMSWWGQWHNSVPETVVGTNEGQAGPWEQPAWICQRENLPDQYDYLLYWDGWLYRQREDSGYSFFGLVWFFASFRSQLLHHLHPSGTGDGKWRLWLIDNTHLCPFFLIHINNSLMLHTHKPKIEKVFAWIWTREQGPEDVGRKHNNRYMCWNTLDEFIQVQALQTVSRTARNCFYDSL